METFNNDIYKKLEEQNFCVDIVNDFEVPGVFGVLIKNGNWREDHARLDDFMDSVGYNHITTVVVDEQKSGTYSAVHYFCLASN